MEKQKTLCVCVTLSITRTQRDTFTPFLAAFVGQASYVSYILCMQEIGVDYF